MVILKPLCNGFPLWLVGGEPETIYRALVATRVARWWQIEILDQLSGSRSDLPGGGETELCDLLGGGR